MSRVLAALAAITCVLGFAVAPAPPARADSVTPGGPGWSVALTFPDVQWASDTCQFVPVTAVVTGAAVESWTYGGVVSGPSDEDVGYTWLIDYDKGITNGTGSFTFRHAVMLCPGYDWSGTYEVVGEVGAKLVGAADWAWVPYRARFTVTGIPTTTSLEPIAVADGQASFDGSVVVTPPVPTSFQGCRGSGVDIQVQTPAGEWEGVGYAELATDGSFSTTVPGWRLTGTQYRASFGGGLICAVSSSQPQVLPVRLPTVTLRSNSKQSKLLVDIDPDLGRRSWVFQVQRQVGDDAWRTVRTARTIGKHETRTLNLRKGWYRIHVKAQRGFAETYSDSTYLER